MLFTYKGLENGKPVKGNAEAENEQKVIEYLKSKEITIVSVTPKQSCISLTGDISLGKVSFNDVVDFTRQLSIMLSAGLSIVDSLDILKKQSTNKTVLKLINDIKMNITTTIATTITA